MRFLADYFEFKLKIISTLSLDRPQQLVAVIIAKPLLVETAGHTKDDCVVVAANHLDRF